MRCDRLSLLCHQVDSNSQNHEHKLLFLTDSQANLLAETDGSMEKLVKAFEWRKPKLVITFLRSIGGIGWFKSLPGDVLYSSDAGPDRALLLRCVRG